MSGGFNPSWVRLLPPRTLKGIGYITSSASNHPVNFFGLFTLPLLPENKPLAKVFTGLRRVGKSGLLALVRERLEKKREYRGRVGHERHGQRH